MLNAFRADLKANRPNPLIVIVLFVYRFGSWVHSASDLALLRPVLWKLYQVMDLFFVRIMCCAELDARCQIGPGLRLPHGANGIVVHRDSVIGKHVTLYHQVTLGGRSDEDSSPPVLGDHVEIFTGARILGSVKVGEGSVVGANAVVIKDVPDYCLAVGVPARIIDRRQAYESQRLI